MSDAPWLVESGNNETLAWSMGIALPNEIFPIDDVVFHAQFRQAPGAEVALDFSTVTGSLSVSDVDDTAKTLVLSFTAADAAVANMLGVYTSDLKLIRGLRKNDIEQIVLTITAGITRE